ncbi:MAG: NADP-specific glutamate dehydrogenase [Myxococcota bacterium]
MHNPAPSQTDLESFMTGLVRRNPGQEEFHQAVQEVAENILPFLEDHPEYQKAHIFERMTEPDRVIIFRVCWQDDDGNVRVNRGTRVQFNNAIGPYKGGLRFHPSVTLGILKFLGFEQTFKNSLTGLPMGGAKGGANFNPRDKSDGEVMRFCQAFMTELSRHIGKNVDIPAGDIGVGEREVSYLFGQYKRIMNEFTGAITGKGLSFGGSLIRTEATGYGNVYFTSEILRHHGEDLEGKTCLVSGSGNVAQYTVERAVELGARVVTISDSDGFVYDRDGLNDEKLADLIDLKTHRRGRVSEFAEKWGCEYHAGKRPWIVPCDVAFPSATQNEIDEGDARTLVKNGVSVVSEGANMPTSLEAARVFRAAGVRYAPSKAANAGGVAVSGLEQTQNSMRLSWSRAEVDNRLREIMRNIHRQCVRWGEEGDSVDYVKGANIAGFVKVANAMLAQGIL